ncbi:MAG: hypothetical protein ACK52W_08375 [Alphaproteobacteria bacterium]
MDKKTAQNGKNPDQKPPSADGNHALVLSSLVRRVNEDGDGICQAVYKEAYDDPKLKAVLDDVQKDILRTALLVRMPVTGPFMLAHRITQQANEKMSQGDTVGAVSNYFAAIGAGTSQIFMMGDVAIEAMRAGGVQIDRSPIARAYYFSTGLRTVCDHVDKKSRQIGLPEVAQTSQAIYDTLSPGQREELERMSKVLQATYERKTMPSDKPVKLPRSASKLTLGPS